MVWLFIFSLGAAFWLILLVVTIGEAIDFATVKRPKSIPFSRMKFREEQRRNIIVPSTVALVSSAFVSLGISFFYDGLTTSKDPTPIYVGAVFLVLSAVILVAILTYALRGTGSAAELASDPFSIRAAAMAVVNDDDPEVSPEILDKKIDEWSLNIAAYSMNASTKRNVGAWQGRLEAKLDASAQSTKRIRRIFEFVDAYGTAVLAFPISFMLAYIYIVVAIVGALAFVMSMAAEVDLPIYFLIAISIFGLLVNGLTAFFYAVFRGGRAVRTHQVYLEGVSDARSAIESARLILQSRLTDRQVLERVDRDLKLLVKRSAGRRLLAPCLSFGGGLLLAVVASDYQRARGRVLSLRPLRRVCEAVVRNSYSKLRS